jgi:hypothetical protein
VPQSFRIKIHWGVVGMLKYLSKFAMDILPSVAATIIGAYIVNHYIAKPAAPPVAAAAVSIAQPKAEVKAPAKPSETSSDLANVPEAGVKAKGVSEKAVIEKSTAEKPADKPAETVSIPVETRRHQPISREKTVAKTAPTVVPPAPTQPSVSAVAPAVAAPAITPSVEVTSPAEERRDANELARAAIERLRGPTDASPRAQEAVRIPDAPYAASAPLASAPPIRPLPPPIMVSTPSGETFDPVASSQPKAVRADDPLRLTPPADIPPSPASRPLDLHADAAEPPAQEHTTVAEDVLSAAKSVFHAVLPK